MTANPMSEKTLELGEFERLVRPLRRLKVSHVWQHLFRDGDIAKGLRSVGELLGLAGHENAAIGYDDMSATLERNPERVWLSTLSLELGELERTYDRSTEPRGQASLHFGSWWRIESPRAIAVSSKTDQGKIEEVLNSFKGRRVLDVQVTGRLPEMIVSFSGKRWIQSFGESGNPAWHIALPDSSCVSSRTGRLVRHSA
jgi:hypothetical protein